MMILPLFRQNLVIAVLVAMLVISGSIFAESYLDQNNLVVDDTGLIYKNNKVGVNILNPTANLDVSGDMRVNGTVGFNETSVSSDSINWKASNKQRIVIDGDTTITFSQNPSYNANLILVMEYDAGVNAGSTITFPSSVSWGFGSAPGFTRIEDRLDIIGFYYSAVDNRYYGVATLGYDVTP